MLKLLNSSVIHSVDQLRVMQHLVHGATLNKGFKSPFRVDRGPGCWLSWFNEKLYYHDPKDYVRNGKNIIDLWCIQNNCEIQDAYYGIYNFNGPIKPVKPVKSPPKYFAYGVRAWEDYDEDYWSKYNLSFEDLESGNPGLFAAQYFEYYSEKMGGLVRTYSKPEKPLYIYCWDNGRAKGYAPLSSQRFMGNSTAEDFYYYEGEPDILYICSGGKDAKVVHSYDKSVFALNGEMYSPSSLPKKILDKYPKIMIGLDNDDTGIEFAIKMKDYLVNLDYNVDICIPKSKDWADDEMIYNDIDLDNLYKIDFLDAENRLLQ